MGFHVNYYPSIHVRPPSCIYILQTIVEIQYCIYSLYVTALKKDNTPKQYKINRTNENKHAIHSVLMIEVLYDSYMSEKSRYEFNQTVSWSCMHGNKIETRWNRVLVFSFICFAFFNDYAMLHTGLIYSRGWREVAALQCITKDSWSWIYGVVTATIMHADSGKKTHCQPSTLQQKHWQQLW